MLHFRKKVALVGLSFLMAFSSFILPTQDADAADLSQFRAGNIISDDIFTNSSTMTVQQIQAFLQSKVGNCDSWGSKTSELGGGTRLQWMAARGIQPPFRCVTDYRENPANGANNYSSMSDPAGSISAAEIIYNYSRQFTINPQTIIATLQKENGLITDQWPTPRQFNESMGFGCPDNVAPGAPACDPQYKNFATQVYQAARHFRGYMDRQYCNQSWCTPYTVGNNYIRWSPNGACGGTNVTIANRATSALYSYTPYQPNPAALAAGYGTGDGCSAYGNRNFYNYFTDWFGSTMTTTCGSEEPMGAQVSSFYNARTGDHFYTPYYCEGNVVRLKLGYVDEGAVFNTSSPSLPGATPVWRLYNSRTTQHLWTSDQAEIQAAQQYAGYTLQGVAFYMAPHGAPGTQPVYRLYNHKTFQHVWTPNMAVANFIAENVGFKFEGVAFYTQ